jgi:hypothetical protein
MDTIVLPIYMAALMTDAAGEIAAVTPGELFERFLVWTADRPPCHGR